MFLVNNRHLPYLQLCGNQGICQQRSRGKLENEAREAMMLGYSESVHLRWS